MWRIRWPDATPGSTQSVRCPGEGDVPGLGLAHRNCLTGGVWDSVDASNCESVAIRDIRIQVGAVMSIARQLLLQCMPNNNGEMCYEQFSIVCTRTSTTECNFYIAFH